MCLVLGGLGGVLAATATRTEPAAARFIPPREPAYDFSLRDQNGEADQPRRRARQGDRADVHLRDLPRSLPGRGQRHRDRDRSWSAATASSPTSSASTRSATRRSARGPGSSGAGSRATGSTCRHARRAAPGLDPLRHRADERDAQRGAGVAAAAADAFLAANPQIVKRPFQYEAPPQPTEPPPGADDAYPDPSDLAYRGRARHIAGWDFEHSAYVMLIDKRGTQRLGIPFESLDPHSLARDMRVLLAEPLASAAPRPLPFAPRRGRRRGLRRRALVAGGRLDARRPPAAAAAQRRDALHVERVRDRLQRHAVVRASRRSGR